MVIGDSHCPLACTFDQEHWIGRSKIRILGTPKEGRDWYGKYAYSKGISPLLTIHSRITIPMSFWWLHRTGALLLAKGKSIILSLSGFGTSKRRVSGLFSIKIGMQGCLRGLLSMYKSWTTAVNNYMALWELPSRESLENQLYLGNPLSKRGDFASSRAKDRREN